MIYRWRESGKLKAEEPENLASGSVFRGTSQRADRVERK